MPDVVIPPRRTRVRFRLLPYRVPPVYRPWVGQQLTAPGYLRRAQRIQLVVPVVLVVVPQTALALADGRAWGLVTPAVFLVVYPLAVLLGRRAEPPERQLKRLLAYHGVAADGRLVPPTRWRQAVSWEPFGKAGAAVFVALVLVFASAVAVAVDRYPERCRPVTDLQVAAIEKEIGRTVNSAQSVAPGATPGTRLTGARRVQSRFPGLSYVGGSVGGTPGVWRVFDLGDLGLTDEDLVGARVTATAADAVTWTLTPSTGLTIVQPEERDLLERARDCARHARS